jgi:small subunit ribosomal protein S20
MANTSSAKKAAKQSVVREERNLSRRTAIKTAIKKVLTALSTDTKEAQELLKDVAAQLSRAKSKGMIHANTAARKLSRLAKKVAQAKA